MMTRQQEREAAGAIFAVKVHLVYIQSTEAIDGGTRYRYIPSPEKSGRMTWAEAKAIADKLRKAFLDVRIVSFRKKRPAKLLWKDIRREKSPSTWDAEAWLGGLRARVCTLPRTGNGKDWGADAGGVISEHTSLEKAERAAEKRLRDAVKRRGPQHVDL